MPYDVFISYSSANSVEAQAICAALEAFGLSCWIAPRNIVAGADWATSIITGINESRAMLLLLSAHSNTSPQVANEVERATNKRVPLLTVRLEDLALTPHLEYFLSSRHWFEAHVPPLEAHLPMLVQTVHQSLSSPSEAHVSPIETANLSPQQQMPTARTLSALYSVNPPEMPNNLPTQVASFIGREKEMDEVKALLDKTRLCTLTGSGGSGKTRLSLQVTTDVLKNYPDGAWFVELAPLADPSLVPQTVAQALGVSEEPGKPLMQALTDALKSKRLLIVLDNCEHVIDACARLVDTLLRVCPNLTVLASSREGFNIAGEKIYRLPPLSLPDVRQAHTAESVTSYESVRLFTERALAVQSTFTVTNANATALAQLCVHLDGIPLALELAAARVRSLSVEEINNKLDNRFRLLTGGSRTALPRQQTLRALIDWSYELLNAHEKTLFNRLSVFAGGWTLAAAEQVGAGEQEGNESLEGWEVLDLLTSLVDKSLVVTQTSDGNTRYRLLETVRQYALEHLIESGESLFVRARQGEFFLAMAEEARTRLKGLEQAQWLQRLEEEHDNLRHALTLYREDLKNAGAGKKGLRLAAALQEFWKVRGYLSEGREWLRALLAHPDGQEPTKLRADALNAAGTLAHLQGDYAPAQVCYEESLAIQRAWEDQSGMAIALNNLGTVAREQGNYFQARVLLAESLEIVRQQGDGNGVASSLLNLGIVAFEQGDYASVPSLFEESLAIFREMGDKRGMAYSLLNLGIVAQTQNDYASARVLYEESLAIRRELGDRRGIAASLNNLGLLTSRQGDYASARVLYEESLAIRRALGDRHGIASDLEAFASLALQEAQQERSARLWGAAAALREMIGSALPLAKREELENEIEDVQRTLGEDAFALVWTQGRAMTVEMAIEFALQNILPVATR